MSKRFFVARDFDDELLETLPQLYEMIDEESSAKNGRIDVIICSDGGAVSILKAFLDAFSVAKDAGVIVATHVSGLAASCGSILAINGTVGYRTIGGSSHHYIHTGIAGAIGRNEVEMERFSQMAKEHYSFVREQYRKNADIPDLDTLLVDDHLFVNARQSKKWGLVDKVMA